MLRRWLAASAVVLVLLGACGGDGTDGAGNAPSGTSTEDSSSEGY